MAAIKHKPGSDHHVFVMVNPGCPALQSALSSAAKDKPTDRAPRISKSILLPDYVWDELRSRYGSNGKPLNLQILEALQKVGVKVLDEDLIDGRKLR